MKNSILIALQVVFVMMLIRPVIWIVSVIVGAIVAAFNSVYYRVKFRKGIKNGEIVKIKGEYYTVSIDL